MKIEPTEATSPLALLKLTFQEWSADNAAQLAAALAYYTLFSIAPLLIIALGVAGLLLGQEAAQGQLVYQITAYTGNPQAAELIQTMIQNLRQPEANIIATVAGLVALFYGAMGTFDHLRSSLNLIWDTPPSVSQGWRHLLLSRLLTLAMVVVSGFLVLLSLIVSTALNSATSWINDHYAGAARMSQVVNFCFFFVLTTVIFALIYKYVPTVRIAWRDVWIGAIATALLFSIARLLITLYLAYSSITSIYGAAGSLVLILLWVYYSAQIFFLGAEFTQVYGRTYGSRQREHELLEHPEATAPYVTTDITTDVTTDTTAETSIAGVAADRAKHSPLSLQQRLGQRTRRILQPVGQLAVAVSVIGLLSVVSMVRRSGQR
jgi:membrane protein